MQGVQRGSRPSGGVWGKAPRPGVQVPSLPQYQPTLFLVPSRPIGAAQFNVPARLADARAPPSPPAQPPKSQEPLRDPPSLLLGRPASTQGRAARAAASDAPSMSPERVPSVHP